MNPKNRFYIIIFFFCVVFLASSASNPQLWWQVELRIAVTGEYAYQTNDKGYEGNYSFTTVVLGSLNDDDEDDFIFVQAYEKTSGLNWKEIIHKAKEKIELNLQGKIHPGATLNYVFARNGELSFDFEIEPVSVPYKNSLLMNPLKSLHLLESAGDETVTDKTHYNHGLISGSNRVVLALKDMFGSSAIERVFKWKWQNNDHTSSWNHSHQVEAWLKIIPLKKQIKE